VPRRCELGHQLVLCTGTHPLHLNLQEHKSQAMIKIMDPIIQTMQYPQKW
jgi:hypothetical protein